MRMEQSSQLLVQLTDLLLEDLQVLQCHFQMGKSGAGQQTATIEQIRFITPKLATVDGSWTVTGVRDDNGKELPAIKGRGFELVQKKNGSWKFIATREMVIFGGS